MGFYSNGRNRNIIDIYTFQHYSLHQNLPNYVTDTGPITRLLTVPDSIISMPGLHIYSNFNFDCTLVVCAAIVAYVYFISSECENAYRIFLYHYSDVMMCAMASYITAVSIVYWTLWSGADHRKHLSSASLAFVRGIYRQPIDSPHKGPVIWKMFPFDGVIMQLINIKLCCRVSYRAHLKWNHSVADRN